MSGTDGEPVTLAVIVGFPILAGLAGGTITLNTWWMDWVRLLEYKVGSVLIVLPMFIGLVFAISAITTSLSLGIAGGVVGMVSALWTTRGGTSMRRAHASLTLGAVSAHRLLEGVALGALYKTGAAVGLLGAIFLAAHTALETAVVGGVYVTDPIRIRRIAAIVLVQLGYVGGVLVGLGFAAVVPVSVRSFTFAVVGGVLLTVGTGKLTLTTATE